MKLDIIYRCCNNETDGNFKHVRPTWYNKLKCLQTFLDSINNSTELVNKVVFVHDGPKGKLYDNIPTKYETILVDYNNNERSMLETFRIADELTNNIYFVEDDYLHLKQSIKVIANGVNKLGLVTGYDHLDRYQNNDDITKGKEYINFLSETNCHWRTCESTCATWSTTRELWQGNVGKLAKKHTIWDRNLFRELFITYNIRLWTPIPGVTTQVDQNLSPGIDWESFSNNL